VTVQVNIHEAKSRLSALVAAALRGDTVVIARSGVPAVRLVPYTASEETVVARRSALGMWAGQFSDAEIDAALAPLTADELAAFYGPVEPESRAVDATA